MMKKETFFVLLLIAAALALLGLMIWLSAPKSLVDAQYRPCDVCKYAKGDMAPRTTSYCPTCNAWICSHCQPDLALRAKAMFNRSAGVVPQS